MEDTLSGAHFTLARWSKAQIILASAYRELARLAQKTSALTASLDVCVQVITPELLAEAPNVWTAASDLYGNGAFIAFRQAIGLLCLASRRERLHCERS